MLVCFLLTWIEEEFIEGILYFFSGIHLIVLGSIILCDFLWTSREIQDCEFCGVVRLMFGGTLENFLRKNLWLVNDRIIVRITESS